MHNSQTVLPGHYRVSVDRAYEDHGMIDLPVPSPDRTTKLRDAEGFFVLWPISLVLFEDKVMVTPSKKVKTTSEDKERVGSCDPKSEASRCAGFEELVGADIVETLTDQCELLFYKLCHGKHETIIIPLKAPLFYLDEDREIWVTSKDVSKFMRGAWANASLIHVYILFLVQDFISVFDMSNIAFLCPQRISAAEIKRDFSAVQRYVNRAFAFEAEEKAKPCKFILAPYIQDEHLLLLVIDLRLGIVFEFDPIMKGTSDGACRRLDCGPVFFYAYKLYRSCLNRSALQNSQLKIVFHPIQCAQQKGGTECGYYVMRYMYEIVSKHNDCKGNLKEEYLERSSAYDEEEMNQVREQWAKFFRTRMLLK